MASDNVVQIQMKFDARAALQDMTDIQKEQFPFAYAKSLTRIAGEAAEAVRGVTREKFELKTDFIPQGIGRVSAKKSDIVSGGKAHAEVFTKERISSFMPKQEYGGTREPESTSMGGGSDKGKMLAMPGKGKEGTQFSDSKQARERLETGSGKIAKSKTPGGLLRAAGAGRKPGFGQGHTQKVKRGGRKGVPFVVTLKSGMPAIVRRVGKKRYPLEILYVFRSSASYDATWGMAETVQDYVNNNFERVFWEEMESAIKTSYL